MTFKLKTFPALFLAAIAISVTAIAAFSHILPFSAIFSSLLPEKQSEPQSFNFSEGAVSKATVTTGIFDIHRKYRSMEGPYFNYSAKVADMVAAGETKLPDKMIVYIEQRNSGPSMNTSSMTASCKNTLGNNTSCMAASSSAPNMMATNWSSTSSARSNAMPKRQLYWLKGVKLEVLDEHNKVLPTAEFICHWNLDVDSSFRNRVFPQAERCTGNRIITITQGQTEITFPEGFAVPVASDEVWHMVFQAANRTSLEHKRVRHRCTMYFIKDKDLLYPMMALNWYALYVAVVFDKNVAGADVLDKAGCSSCFGYSTGVNAPNNIGGAFFRDTFGRRLTGHWVVPSGEHTYTSPVSQTFFPGFNNHTKVVHAIWSHLHPFCTEFSLIAGKDDLRKAMFTVHETTDNSHGIEIKHIDYISSKEGIILDNTSHYELQAKYNNTSGQPQDSMSVAGIFFEDRSFTRPQWTFNNSSGPNCMATVMERPSSGEVSAKPSTPKTR